MDIKLVKNFEEGNYIPVNDQLLLQVVDANYRLGRFPGKKIFMLNPLTNERLEILPEIHKYNLANISYAAVYKVLSAAGRHGVSPMSCADGVSGHPAFAGLYFVPHP